MRLCAKADNILLGSGPGCYKGRIRDCYSERIEMDSDEFVKMILVDSSFIVKLLLLNSDNMK